MDSDYQCANKAKSSLSLVVSSLDETIRCNLGYYELCTYFPSCGKPQYFQRPIYPWSVFLHTPHD